MAAAELDDEATKTALRECFLAVLPASTAAEVDEAIMVRGVSDTVDQ